MTDLIPVSKASEYLEVHPDALNQHKSAGWVVCEKREEDKKGPTLFDAPVADPVSNAAPEAKPAKRAQS